MYFTKKAAVFIATTALTLALAIPVNASSYTVVNNDSIYSISQTFNTSTTKIKTDNNLSSNTIYPGQVLKVPGVDYTVKSGDSLYLIAKRAGISLLSLRKANNKWDNSLYIGQKLVLPIANGVNTSKSAISYSAYELDLLARLINAEAASEPYQAKVGVGAVVVNRVKSSQFPNTISGVIYQKDSRYYQFTPVENGWINKPATSSAKQAALEALNGVDPTNGALYYFDDSATNKWLWSKPIALRVGKMVYVY
ncbi:cell wall hydrolase [Acetivibrio cellulolyticus]|uniref:cell wall hydrolase n=1 Tax=Acetivibrio cellulolyticus TaxID=35830 RepID=UPI0001E2E738|nr:cell wall hydrolase [Acetivibrio cellulolyticus]